MSVIAKTPSARLEETDLLRLRHLLGSALMPVALWSHLSLPNGSPAGAAVAVTLMLAGLVFPGFFARIGPRVWNIAGLAVVALAAGDLALTFATDRSGVVASVIRAAMEVATLRALQPRTRREDMQLLLLALFLGAVGGALSLSPIFGVQALCFIPPAGGLLFLLDRAENARATRPTAEDWRHFRWRSFLARLAAACGRGGALFLGGALLSTLLLGALIFVTLPRYDLENTLPFLRAGGKGRTGFSESLKLGDLSEILADETPALRADTPGNRRPSFRPYWRMIALDHYADGGFTLSARAADDYRRSRGRGAEAVPAGLNNADASPGSPGLRGDWTVYFEGNVSRYLPLPGTPSRVRFTQPQSWEFGARARSLRLAGQPAEGVPMQVGVIGDTAAYRPPASERRELEATSPEVPGGESGKTLAGIVARLSPPGTETASFVQNAEAWLQRRHLYALADSYGRREARPGEPEDYLVRWMASDATGWCEHFAGAFVLLARASGRHARLVTGFAGGEWNDSGAYLLVRMKHGHAWAEIYDREAGFWRRVDPTPIAAGASASADDASRLEGMSGMSAMSDGVTMWWYRRVVNFEESDRRAAADSLIARFKAWRETLTEFGGALRARVAAFVAKVRETPSGLIWPAAALLAFAGVAVALRRRLRARRSARIRVMATDDPAILRYRARAGRLLAALARAGAEEAAIASVRFVRFGRPSAWPDPESTLAAGRAALKKARRRRPR